MNTIKALSIGAVLLASAGTLGGFAAANKSNTTTNAAATTTTAAADSYSVDPVHTNVLFKIRHAGVTNFYGRFNTVKGSVNFDGDFEGSSIDFEIPISSIDTNSSTRDGHLQDAEFFNARQFKNASFESSSITTAGDGVYTLTGDLTLHGQTKTINAVVNEVRTGTFRNKDVLGFEAVFTIKRSEFGIMKYLASDLSDSGGLGNTVEIIVAVEAIKD